jgi:hypothetical protein
VGRGEECLGRTSLRWTKEKDNRKERERGGYGTNIYHASPRLPCCPSNPRYPRQRAAWEQLKHAPFSASLKRQRPNRRPDPPVAMDFFHTLSHPFVVHPHLDLQILYRPCLSCHSHYQPGSSGFLRNSFPLVRVQNDFLSCKLRLAWLR